MANVVPATVCCRLASISRVTIARPNPVAASRPAEPWNSTGLPVTQAGWNPSYLAYSFMIQAMTWASVPMSGAGMSLSGPIMSWIFSMNFRVSRSSSPRESLRRVAIHPALGPAERQVDDRRLPRHQAGQRPRLVLVHRRMVAQAPLVGPARIVVLDPIADEVADLPRVQLDRHLDPHLAVGRHQQRPDVLRQVELLRRLVEVIIRRLEGLHQNAVPRITVAMEDRPEPSVPRPAPIVTDRPRRPQCHRPAPPRPESHADVGHASPKPCLPHN